MKKIFLFLILSVIISIIIYDYTKNKKLDILIIGDSVASGDTIYGNSGISYNLFLKEYLKNKNLRNYDLTYVKNNMTVRDFNYLFSENNEINDKHLQNRIKEAEIIIISLGQDELVGNSKINNLKNIERKQFYNSHKKLLLNIRKISNEKIYIIGYFGNKINQLNEIENNLIKIANKYNCKYLKINNIILEADYFDSEKTHLNYKGHKKIFMKLKSEINTVLNNK